MATAELRSKRRRIESARARGEAPGPAIGESWSRCRRLVGTDTKAAPVDTEPDEVAGRWEASRIRRSGVGLEERLAEVADAGDLVAAVTDEEGRILWSAGGRTMRRAAEQVGFIPGGRWDEGSAGTNALGLALLTRRPSTVFSAEHWCDAVRDWVCWSVPILDADGACLGVIDLSGRWDRATPVAEVVVATLGRLVEEHLPPEAARPDAGVLRLQLLGRPRAVIDGRTLPLAPRQLELLAALALEGPSTLDELRLLVYGDRPVSAATIKAELSHLRNLLGGRIGSRPYELTIPVEVDVHAVRLHLRAGRPAGGHRRL